MKFGESTLWKKTEYVTTITCNDYTIGFIEAILGQEVAVPVLNRPGLKRSVEFVVYMVDAVNIEDFYQNYPYDLGDYNATTYTARLLQELCDLDEDSATLYQQKYVLPAQQFLRHMYTSARVAQSNLYDESWSSETCFEHAQNALLDSLELLDRLHPHRSPSHRA